MDRNVTMKMIDYIGKNSTIQDKIRTKRIINIMYDIFESLLKNHEYFPDMIAKKYEVTQENVEEIAAMMQRRGIINLE